MVGQGIVVPMKKKEKHKIKLPLNIPERYINLFRQKNSYSIREEAIKNYNNVFVTYDGMCLKNFKLLSNSSFNIKTKYDISFKWKYWKLVIEQFFVSKYGKSLASLHLNDENTYYVIHTKWFNYSFWISSSVFRLLKANSYDKEMILLYPEFWDNINYIQETLAFFPDLKKKIIPEGQHCFVKNFCLPEVREFTAGFTKDSLFTIKHFFEQRINSRNYSFDRIYITRENAKYRKIQNEKNVIQLLKEFNFTIVDFDVMSFVDQVSILRNAKILVTLHGAAMANTIFMSPNSKVLELMHEFKSEKSYRFSYWIQSSLVEIDYYVQFCTTLNQHENVLFCDLIVDIDLLQKNLNLMLS